MSPEKTQSYLLINSAKFWGGGEQWFLSAARGLAARGHEVTVAGRHEGVFLRRLAVEGIRTLPLSLASDWALGDTRRLRRWLAAVRPVAVLCNFTRDVRVAGRAIRWTWGARPALVWVTGSILLKHTFRHRRLVQQFVDCFIVPSRALKEEMLAFPYIDPSMIHVLPIGLDLTAWLACSQHDVLAARAAAGLPETASLVGVFGRLEPGKGHVSLLTAWAEVVGKHRLAQLWIIGTGSSESKLRGLVKERNIANVQFVGFAEDVRSVMLACDVVVQPSLYEPFGIVLLEAMACAKPVICTAVGGMTEVVESDRTALVVPPDTPQALARTLDILLGDARRRKDLGTAGRLRVEQHFRLDEMMNNLEHILHSAKRRKPK